MSIDKALEKMSDLDIAIIGMSVRFPGANSVEAFWRNLQNKTESISFFSCQDLADLNLDKSVLESPNYVKAAPILEDIESFDAGFFGFSPKEAEFIDPQNRLFMECAWEALERAGYDPETYEGLIGVYGGVSSNTYFLNNIYKNIDLTEIPNVYAVNKDFLATSISYKLNLKGPSVSVQTYCSTSLVATHLACKSLLDEECDMALAGGVAIKVPQKSGYWYQEDGISSPDGHCRAFDANAQGTIFGNGLGIVLLKRLKDAVADRDCIHAVIKGSAINNDGSLKVSYGAPSVNGQAEVVVEALANAGINAGDISYVEAHGTGTTTGDPVEIAALTKAFRIFTNKNNFCAVSSVKPNIGHLDTAAGVASLIKAVLALKHKQIPPILNFETPNPQIDFDNSPFYINTELIDWKAEHAPRRAGVSSLGFGGTNAHVILEEAPTIDYFEQSRPWQLLLLSAKTASALENATANLSAYLKRSLDVNLADVAYTLQIGRRAFNHRRMLVCQSHKDGLSILRNMDHERIFSIHQEHREQPVIFMFPGQGEQYVAMAQQLYEVEPTFKKQVDACAQILHSKLNLDIRQILFPKGQQIESASQQLQQTDIAQPALFVIEYALAYLWQEWGVRPEGMIGYGIGEYVAATIAGVFSLEDALTVVVARAKLIQQLPAGSMLSISLPVQQVQAWLEQLSQEGRGCQIAAVNGPSTCVVSGAREATALLQHELSAQGIECQLLQTSHAFHSEMMEPILAPFVQILETIQLESPRFRFISSVTGEWVTAEQATSPSYWSRHLRQTVRFSAGISQLLEEFEGVFLEVGPGQTLTTLTTQHLEPESKQQVLRSLQHPQESQSDVAFLLEVLGQLWLAGVDIDWSGFYSHEQRHRLPLPTYPFERQRYWIEPPQPGEADRLAPMSVGKKPDIADWFYVPCWKQSVPPIPIKKETLTTQNSCVLVFVDESSLGTQLVEGLQAQNQSVIIVKVGAEFTQISEGLYTLNPSRSDDYNTLLKDILSHQRLPERIVHLWNITTVNRTEFELPDVRQAQETGFYSLLFLAQALGKQNLSELLQLTVISNNLQSVTGEESLSPEKATLLGPIKVIPQEYPTISCCSIDVVLPSPGSWQQKKLIEQLLIELAHPISERMIAYRGHNRWVQTFDPVRLDELVAETPRLRKGGVYLITGGLGGIGLVLAKYLAEATQAKLILTGRSALPARDAWNEWLATHEETDSTSSKMRKVQELEALGAEVLLISADVANLAQMKEAVAQAQQQFGQLHGVIHAAGIVGGKSFDAIAQLNKTNCEQQFQSKVYGLLVLEEILQGKKLDFCLLMSSLSSVLGGLGYVAYGAANLFMDAFTYQHNQNHPIPWLSINWDTWGAEGEKQAGFSQTSLAEFVFTPEEGIKAFQRILSRNKFHSQIVVSTGDLQFRLKKWIFPLTMKERNVNQKSSLYPRPDLQNAFVPPGNEIEKKLADIWQNLLGIEQVGIYDNFFELGGDSFLAIQIHRKMQEIFNQEFLPTDLFEYPTIKDLANCINPEHVEQSAVQQAHSRATKRQSAKDVIEGEFQLIRRRRRGNG